MSDATTLQTLLSTGTETAAAIGAPSRKALTHGELRALIARTDTSSTEQPMLTPAGRTRARQAVR